MTGALARKVALVDDADYERVSRYGWYAHFKPNTGRFYARANDKRLRQRAMPRFILGAPESIQVDHRDRDGLNNQRTNMRLATNSQNAANRPAMKGHTLPKGVSFDQKENRYRAGIECNGQRYRSKRMTNAEDAAAWYGAKARAMFGEFARTEA